MTAATEVPITGIDPAEPSVTVSEATKARPVSKWTIYRLIDSGDLPAWRIGKGKIRFRLSDLDRLAVPVVPRARD